MSRTDHRNASSYCTCNLPIGFFHELDNSLRSISEVIQALDLIEALLDPLPTGGRPMLEMDREQLSALLRILNNACSSSLSVARNALDTAMQ
ncbi:MAG: hypothetical protein EOO23_03780 [Comamonadaceae bacterium]|nr:MAG: hypothetical protein EOO23_03780 [Comamonadaceae bacterium]